MDEAGKVKVGETLADLAGLLGIPLANLADAIERYDSGQKRKSLLLAACGH